MTAPWENSICFSYLCTAMLQSQGVACPLCFILGSFFLFLFFLSLPAPREEEEGWIGINTKTNLFVGKEKLCSSVPVGFINKIRPALHEWKGPGSVAVYLCTHLINRNYSAPTHKIPIIVVDTLLHRHLTSVSVLAGMCELPGANWHSHVPTSWPLLWIQQWSEARFPAPIPLIEIQLFSKHTPSEKCI